MKPGLYQRECYSEEAESRSPDSEWRTQREFRQLLWQKCAAEVDVGGEGDEPGKDHAGESCAEHVTERVFRREKDKGEREEDPDGRVQDGVLGRAFVIEAAKAGGSPAGAGE